MIKVMTRYLSLFFLILLPSIISAKTPQFDFGLTVGFEKNLEIDFTPNDILKITNESLVSFESKPELKKIILKGLKKGETVLTLKDQAGNIKVKYFITIALPDEDMIKKSCFNNQFTACADLGKILISKERVQEAKIYFTRACTNKYYQSCLDQGKIEESLGDLSLAIEVFKKACDDKNIEACDLYKSDVEILDVINKNKSEKEILELSKKCEKGDSLSCLVMGVIELQKSNFTKAKVFFEKECEKKFKRSCQYKEINESTEKYISLKFKECNGSNPKGESCLQLGIYFSALRRVSETRVYLEKSCLNHFADGCIQYAEFEIANNKIEKGREIYQKECAVKNASACYALAQVEFKDIKNFEEALKYYKLACESEVILACEFLEQYKQLEEKLSTQIDSCLKKDFKECLNVATIYNQKNLLSKARKYYVLACSSDLYEACKALSILDLKLGNYPEAKSALFNFCENGNGEACFLMAELNKKQGSIKDQKRYYNMACIQDHYRSCFNLGEIELKEENKIEAKRLLKKACNYKFQDACDLGKKIFLTEF